MSVSSDDTSDLDLAEAAGEFFGRVLSAAISKSVDRPVAIQEATTTFHEVSAIDTARDDVEVTSRSEAIAAGREPCRYCFESPQPPHFSHQ